MLEGMRHLTSLVTRHFVLGHLLLCFLACRASAELPELKIGADLEAGAPYVFPDPADPQKLTGFEAQLAQALAKQMGRKAVFVQNQWDGLVPGLKAGHYDLVMNGLEITEDRKHEIAFSDPYYLTYEQLTVRRESRDMGKLEDLKGLAVGTLKFSLAQRMLEALGGVDVKSYDDEVNIYADLEHARTEAVLLDAPIALYYAGPNPALKAVGEPIGRMAYGIGLRQEDKVLLAEVDAGLGELAKKGILRKVLEDWALWNPLMAEAFHDPSPSPPSHPQYEAFLKSSTRNSGWKERLGQYARFLPLLGRGAAMTLLISLASMLLAVGLGLGLTLGRLYGPGILRAACLAWVELVRGTPLLIQLYLIYYGLPNLGLKLPAGVAAVLGLGLNYAAYESENYRAGILSIPGQQTEAALSLGMSRFQAFRHVVLPQALRFTLLPATNDFISLLKDSSLVSVITLVELTKEYGELASTTYDYLGLGLVTAALYFLLGLPFVRLSRWLEARMAYEARKPHLAED
jgi:polar amino acid transport system substrate-binding protein